MDLKTTYMGLPLKNPLVASSSPLSERVDNIKRMEDAGAAAVVMFSIFEEQLRHEAAAMDHLMNAGSESFAEALSYFPNAGDYRVGPDHYLDLIQRASQAVKIPVIGSLNGISDEGWIDYARRIEQAGAKAIELNVYNIPTDPKMTSADVEQQYYDVFTAVKKTVKIPVAVKLSPFFSSMAHVAQRFDQLGVDGLVLFNRFIQPDFDLDEMEVVPNLGPSSPNEIRLPLRWIAILHGRLRCSLAASRGVHSSKEIIKYILAGADVTMTTWSLLKMGIGHLSTMLADLEQWMAAKEYDSVAQMRGAMSQKSVGDPTAFERANYVRTLSQYKNPFAISQ